MLPFLYTWKQNFQTQISYSTLKVSLISNKTNSFRHIIYPLELDLKFLTNRCWDGSGDVGVQCTSGIVFCVNSADSFIYSFVYSNYIHKPLWCAWHKRDTSNYNRKSSPDFTDLVESMRGWGESRHSTSNFNEI